MVIGFVVGLVAGVGLGWFLARKYGAKGDAVVAAVDAAKGQG